MPGKSTRSPKSKKQRDTTTDSTDAIAVLENDHRDVETLFERYDAADGVSDRRELARAICIALKVHATIEEQLFYPAAMEATGQSDLLLEAMVEHASAKDLIAQIEAGSPDDPLFSARVTVLREYVAHHVSEEEDELFPLCRDSGMELTALGDALLLRKQALLAGMAVPNPVLLLL